MAILSPQGTLLQHGVGTGTITYTTIAQRIKIGMPDLTRAAVKTTDLDTVTAHTYRPSALYNPGELSMTGNYDPANATHQTIQTSMTTQVVDPWKVQFSDGSSCTFSGFLSKFQPGDQIEEGDEKNVEFMATIHLSGPITFTPHS